jgi:hypothetical protein
MFPFFRPFFPNRCEIQFKSDYRWEATEKTSEVDETRFEFRNASHPFSLKKSAPPAPWPEAEYLGYARSGKYKEFRTKPMQALIQTFTRKGRPTNNIELDPVLVVETERSRLHLDFKNPWGSGPNPDQVFIVTIDRSTFAGYGAKSSDELPTFLELEVQIDRNITHDLELASKLTPESIPDHGVVASLVSDFSQKVYRDLHSDLRLLRNEISKVLEGALGTPLPLNYKYARMIRELHRVEGKLVSQKGPQ